MDPKTITQYRSELTFDDHSTITITGADMDAVQDKIRKLLPGKLRFQNIETQAGNSMQVFHESHFKANEPVGWIASYDVPNSLSVRAVTEARLGQQRAA